MVPRSGQPMTEPCRRCGELGCNPELHDGTAAELLWIGLTGALLGATLLGLFFLPLWLPKRGLDETGEPLERIEQDRRMTAILSAWLTGIVAIAALTVFGVTLWKDGALGGLPIPTDRIEWVPELDETDDLVRTLASDSPERSEIAGRHLLELAPRLSVADLTRLVAVYDELDEDARFAVREALRRNEWPLASEALADLYPAIEDLEEREATLAALGRCASPRALRWVLVEETERYRTPGAARQLNVGCVRRAPHALLALAAAHRAERAPVYRALARACDFDPPSFRRDAGAAVADAWMGLEGRDTADPAVAHLAHALACADEALVDRALATVPEGLDDWARAELRLVAYRLGHIDVDTLLAEAEREPALRRTIDAHYEGSAPWRDLVRAEARGR